MAQRGDKKPAAAEAPTEGELRSLELLNGVLEALPDTRVMLEALMDIAMEGLRVERGAMLFFDQPGKAWPEAISRGLEENQFEGIKARFSSSALAEMQRSGTLVVVPDVSTDERFKDAKSVTQAGILSLLVAPIRVADELAGAIYLDVRRGRRTFGDSDRTLVESLARLAGRALEKSGLIGELRRQNFSLRQDVSRYAYGGLIGTSPAMQRLFRDLDKVCANPDPVTVLIEGENGTGKSQVAKLVHENSPRRSKHFVSVRCDSPEGLFESELFGHERGAFTGAVGKKDGLLVGADGGTIFFDDVNLLSPIIQSKLLHFIQEREFRPVGGNRSRRVDVRIICAANKDLRELVAQGEFREDLYYRLNFVVLPVPPLRERKEDIPLLARHFLEEAATRSERDLRSFTPEALSLMMRYHWPGNVRELQSEIAHAVTMAEGSYVGLRDFKSRGFRGEVAGDTTTTVEDSSESMNLDRAIEQLTRHLMANALENTSGHVTRAAQLIGVSRGRFYDLARKYGVDVSGKKG